MVEERQRPEPNRAPDHASSDLDPKSREQITAHLGIMSATTTFGANLPIMAVMEAYKAGLKEGLKSNRQVRTR